MRLPTQKKILREDLKEAPSWVNGIIDPVNSFMENVYQSLNKNITLSENIASFIKEINYTTSATYPSGMSPVTFMNNLRTRASGVMVMQAYDKGTYTPAPGPVYIPWVESDGSLTLGTITGLEADKTYLIRLVVF